jgi:uncharacterized C2H2 Zn-finger protein
MQQIAVLTHQASVSCSKCLRASRYTKRAKALRVRLRVGQGLVDCPNCCQRFRVSFSRSVGLTVGLTRHRPARRWGLPRASGSGALPDVPVLLGASAFLFLGGAVLLEGALSLISL